MKEATILKNQKFFPGMLLLGFGTYFFLKELNISAINPYLTWPTILIILGLAFFVQAYKGREYVLILPAVIMFGFGIHFHIIARLDVWPDHIAVLLLIIALGFILQYQKTGQGLFLGIFFLLFATIMLFYSKLGTMLGFIENGASSILSYWPLLLLVFGVYYLFMKK